MSARKGDGMARQPMIRSFPMVATLVLAVGLFVLAALRWRENGWGSLVWLTVFVAMIAIRTPHSLRNRANVIVEARKDATETLLLVAMFAAMMVLPLFHLATGAFAFADYSLPAWAVWTGVIAQLPSVWLFWHSHADLGRNWSPGLEVRDEHALVTYGIYARIRHPMYAAIWISALAQPLLIPNWIAGPLVVPAFAAMWFLRVPKEEAMMRQTFGAAYGEYCARTGRLFPR